MSCVGRSLEAFIKATIFGSVIGLINVQAPEVAAAATLDFDFSISGPINDGATYTGQMGTISGEIELPSGCTTCGATDLILFSTPATLKILNGLSVGSAPFDIFSLLGIPSTNSFTVSGGALTVTNFSDTKLGCYWPSTLCRLS